jgi:hypothetical protein
MSIGWRLWCFCCISAFWERLGFWELGCYLLFRTWSMDTSFPASLPWVTDDDPGFKVTSSHPVGRSCLLTSSAKNYMPQHVLLASRFHPLPFSTQGVAHHTRP